MTLTFSYLVFAGVSIGLTIWVGHALKKHGAVLLSAGELGELAIALSDLLAMGFYLFHIGFALLILRYGTRADNLPEAIETVSTKLGLVLLVLAVSHFIHLAVFSRYRRRPNVADLRAAANVLAQPVSAEILPESI